MAKVMIKPKAPKPPPPGKGVVKAEKGGLPTSFQDKMLEDAGKGVSAKPEDNLVPMMTLVQDNTPEAQKKHAKYIEGCEGGQIWLKNYSEPFVTGEDGLIVQHCHSYKALVEWKPRNSGGGLMGVHEWDMDPTNVIEDAKHVPDPRDNGGGKMMWVRKNGNEIIDTRYEVVRIFMDNGDRPQYVIPFTSTGHTVAKGWNTLRGTFHLKTGEVAPSFALMYRMTTKSRTNAKGTWFQFNVVYESWLPDNEEGYKEYLAGLALHNAFNRGEKKGDTSTLDQGADEEAM